jgi:hypothetical protein
MKILVLLALVGCTQKYTDYDLIRKVDFQKETYERPIPATQVLSQGSDSLGECFGQWLFFSNAEKQKDTAFPTMIRVLCPGKDYLVQTQVKETWWTTLFFTQSCVNIQTKCGQARLQK